MGSNGTGGPPPVPFGVVDEPVDLFESDRPGAPVGLPGPFRSPPPAGRLRHPNTAATPTSTGTDTTVDSRTDSRARHSATR